MFYILISHKNQNQNQNLNLNPPYKTDICSEINFLTNSIVLTSHHVKKKKVFERYTNQVPQRQEPLSHLASQTRHGSTLSASLSVSVSLSLSVLQSTFEPTRSNPSYQNIQTPILFIIISNQISAPSLSLYLSLFFFLSEPIFFFDFFRP
jgi:hypothetical protein